MTRRVEDDLLTAFFESRDVDRAPAGLLARSMRQAVADPQWHPLVARLRLRLLRIDAPVAAPGSRSRPLVAVGVGLLLVALIGVALVGALFLAPRPPLGGILAYVTLTLDDFVWHPGAGETLHLRRHADDPTTSRAIPGVFRCPTFSPDGRHVAWNESDSGSVFENRVVIANANGSDPRVITPPAYFAGIAWRDDRTLLLRSTRVGFYLVAVADGAVEPMPALDEALDVTPSPDGSRLAVIRADGEPDGPPADGEEENIMAWTGLRLSITGPDGTGAVEVATTPDPTGGLTPGLPHRVWWSPDGRRIAYLAIPADEPPGSPAASATTWELFVLDVESREVQRITDDDAIKGPPSWSTDGRRLAFTSDVDGVVTARVADLDGGQRSVPVGGVDGDDTLLDVAWAPGEDALLAITGTKAEEGYDDRGTDLAIVPLDGGPSRSLVTVDDLETSIHCVAWQVIRP